MNKAITSLVFVLAFMPHMKADGLFAEANTTGTSFENRPSGALDTSMGDGVDGAGGLYWLPYGIVEGAVVTNYADGEAYDYAAHGTARNGFLSKTEPTTNKYLAVDLDAALDRTILPCDGDDVSDVYLKTADYDGIYADVLVKFSSSVAGPVVDGSDRIIVWMKETELDDGSVETNLIVTAGRYSGRYDRVVAADYRILSPTVSADTWCRLTVRAISDVTEYRVKTTQATIAEKAPGFTVYLDGNPAVIVPEDYDIGIGTVVRKDVLTPEARVLISERRLLPGLPAAGTSKAVTLSRFSFAGLGAVDDVSFSTARPEYVVAENVFTLKWDSGVVGTMKCIVSNADVIVTNEIDATQLPRYRDFALGTNNYALVTVTNVVYDFEHGYSNGVWTAENGCATNANGFVCNSATNNPTGYVVSSRDVIGVGGDGCETFAEAKKLAAAKGGRQTLLLMTNVVIAVTPYGAIYRDSGYFPVSSGDDLILDLNGHTLQGRGENPTVSQSGGSLFITDTSDAKNGRVLPSARDPDKVAVESYAWPQWAPPVLTIDAGWYDGLVSVTGKVSQWIGNVNCKAVCSIKGGSYTNVYDDAYHFYLDQYVTNDVPQYFCLVDDYWVAVTNGFIWCGKGADTRWTNKDNWKGKAVPGAGDLAIFPAIESGAWDVDFGAGVETKALWLDGGINMAGTNEFADVKVVSGKGRFVGTGLATFTKKLPGMLTGATGTGEIRLGAEWAGTVKISKVTAPKVLKDIMGWGTSRSTVELNGVRGYLSDRANYAMPYALVLTDDGNTPAWKNDTGYTGSTVSFPKLSGTGTFDSPKNATQILQVFQFMDVRDFAGVFKLGGKRLLLGSGVVTSQAKAGHITFSDAVNVRSGLGWSGVNAHFGDVLYVQGQTNDVLMTYTDTASVPSVGDVQVLLLGRDGTTNECSLVVSGKDIVVTNVVSMARRTVSAGGRSVLAEDIGSNVKSGGAFVVPTGSAVTIDGNRVVINGAVVSSFANYYVVQQIDGSTYSVQFDEEEVAPTLAEFSVSESDGTVTVKVDNAKDGLWYGLQTTPSLAGDWQGPAEWKQPVDGMMTFDPGLTGTANFFRVLVTDRDPNGGVK